MKKWWVVLAVSVVLICWTGCATAEWYFNCATCGWTAGYVEDCGEYHRNVCSAYGHVGEAEPHVVYCNDVTQCGICGNSANLSNANFGHAYEETTYDEYKHYKVCACGTTEEYHRAQCWRDRTVCNDCGASDVVIAEENLYHYFGVWSDVNGLCQMKCRYCDAVTGEAMPHYSFCDEPDKCVNCGSQFEPTEDNVMHELEYINLGDEHARKCTKCEYASAAEAHYSYCDDPNTCDVCEYQFEPDSSDIRHISVEYVDVSDKHEAWCSGCQAFLWSQAHYAWCSDPTTCAVCGVQSDGMQCIHYYRYVDDGEYHKIQCDSCDYTSKEKHYGYCDYQPDTCAACGATVALDESEYNHSVRANVVITDAKHSFDCKVCDTHVEYAHIYDNGYCMICGYKKGSLQPSLPGDADGSDSITLSDALAILAGDVSNEANADVTGDGKVNEQDALRIMQYDAGWDVTLQ